jgi:EAL domain-containing protein (putative c-di-GMP-specific phosphodiesterase class I)
MRESCRQASAWKTALPDRSLVVSFNLSARELQCPDLVERIDRIVREADLDPGSLRVEITETLAMTNPEQMVEALSRLRNLGVRLAIDDFGTGYSSLTYLKRFPVDTLKIDKSFISSLGVDPEDTAIVRATLALAQTLGLSTTAEEIETAEQLDYPWNLGCQTGQGYLYARPMPPESLMRLLSA